MMTMIPTLDVTRPIETEDGRRCTVLRINKASDQIVVTFEGSAHKTDTIDYPANTGFYWHISTGHFGGSNGNPAFVRLRNVGGRVRPYSRRNPPPTPLRYATEGWPRWTNHGGHCCGVSHMYGFDYDPNGHYTGMSRAAGGDPRHTGEAQFKLAVQNCRNSRAAGMIEIVLKRSQENQWKKIITEAGFEKVAEFTNSNTNNKLRVYHYYYGTSNEKKTIIKDKVANPFIG